MHCAAYGLSTDRLTPHPFNLCSNAGSTHTSISQTQPLDMTLRTCTQLLWSTMARSVLRGTCPFKPLYGLGHRAAAVSGSWQSSYSLRHLYVEQRSQFQSSRPPPLCIFRMLLLSLQMFVLFERKCPAKWTSQDIPPWFQFEANVYIPFKVHWSVSARRELKLYIFTEVYDVTLVRAWRRCAVQIHEWMFRNKVNFPCSGSREQWTLCREHVNRNTVHAWSALLTSWLSESGVLTKRDMQNMQSGGARGQELRTSDVEQQYFFFDPQRVLCHEVPCWTSSDQYGRVRAITPNLTHLLPIHTWDLVTLTSHMTPGEKMAKWAQFGHFHLGCTHFCGQRFRY